MRVDTSNTQDLSNAHPTPIDRTRPGLRPDPDSAPGPLPGSVRKILLPQANAPSCSTRRTPCRRWACERKALRCWWSSAQRFSRRGFSIAARSWAARYPLAVCWIRKSSRQTGGAPVLCVGGATARGYWCAESQTGSHSGTGLTTAGKRSSALRPAHRSGGSKTSCSAQLARLKSKSRASPQTPQVHAPRLRAYGTCLTAIPASSLAFAQCPLGAVERDTPSNVQKTFALLHESDPSGFTHFGLDAVLRFELIQKLSG